MNNKLKEWALVAEIAGGIAILISLTFLIVELRNSTLAQQRATYNELTSTIDDWRNGYNLNPEIRDIVYRFENGEEVSPQELRTVSAIGTQLYSIYERAFLGNEYGQMGVSEWTRFERMICNSRPRFWQSNNSILYTDEFVEFVNSCSGD